MIKYSSNGISGESQDEPQSEITSLSDRGSFVGYVSGLNLNSPDSHLQDVSQN